MADKVLGSLQNAWGVDPSGPDPTRLPGLLELGESWLTNEENNPADLLPHFEAMKNNIVGSHMEQTQSLEVGEFDPLFVALVEKKLEEMEAVEAALEGFIEASSDGEAERDLCFEALGELEEATESFKEASDAVNEFLGNSPPVCMACKSIGPEALCPKCGGERLILDPNPADMDEETHRTGDEAKDVYECYYQVMGGKSSMKELSNHLQSLEFTYLEAEAIAEQTISSEDTSEQEKKANTELLESIRLILAGVTEMHGVTQSRKAAELASGWRKILENTTKAAGLLEQALAMEEEGKDGRIA